MTNIAELTRRIGVELDPQLRSLLADVLAELEEQRQRRWLGERASERLAAPDESLVVPNEGR